MPSRRQSCAVRGCRQYKEKLNNQSNANTKPLYDFQPNNISFHRFPTNPEIRKRWIENLDVDGSLGLASKKVEHMVVCSQHFTEKCFKTKRKNQIIDDLKRAESAGKQKLPGAPPQKNVLHRDAFPTKKLWAKKSVLPHMCYLGPGEVCANSLVESKAQPGSVEEALITAALKNYNHGLSYHNIVMAELLVKQPVHSDRLLCHLGRKTWGVAEWTVFTESNRAELIAKVLKDLSVIKCFRVHKERWYFSLATMCDECKAKATFRGVKYSFLTPFERFSIDQEGRTNAWPSKVHQSSEQKKKELFKISWLKLLDEEKSRYYDEFDMNQYKNHMQAAAANQSAQKDVTAGISEAVEEANQSEIQKDGIDIVEELLSINGEPENDIDNIELFPDSASANGKSEDTEDSSTEMERDVPSPDVCIVRGCRHSSLNSKPLFDSVSYHCFPINSEVREKWIENIDPDGSMGLGSTSRRLEGSKVCSLHFSKRSFRGSHADALSVAEAGGKKHKRQLLLDAIPTDRLPICKPQQRLEYGAPSSAPELAEDVAEEKDPLSIDGPDLILECSSYKSETIVKRNFDQNDATNSSQQDMKMKRRRKQDFSILRKISLKTKGVPEMSNNPHVCEIPTTPTELIHADILKQLSGPPKDIQDVFIGYYNKQLQPSDPNGFLQTLSDAPWKTSIRAILRSSDCFRLQKNSCRWTFSSRLCSLCRCTKYCK